MKLIATILLSIFWTAVSFACTCEMTPIENHIHETDFIVTVQVIEMLDTQEEREDYFFSKPDQSYRVKVEITKTFKGDFKERQIIELGSNFSNCDIYYKDKNEYLLFLRKDGEKFFINPCSYSEHIEKAKENLIAIEKELKK
jgi:hypothetical protein